MSSFAVWLGSRLALATVLALTALWLAAAIMTGLDAISVWVGAATGMVSLILLVVVQGSSNEILAQQAKDAAAMQTKLDALILGNEKVSNRLIGLERQTDGAIEAEARRIAKVRGL